MINIWEDLLDIKGIGLEETFQQLGGNSITLNFLQSKIMTNFGVFLSFKEMWSLNTVKVMCEFISPLVNTDIFKPEENLNGLEKEKKQEELQPDNLLEKLNLDLPSQYMILLDQLQSESTLNPEASNVQTVIELPDCIKKKVEAYVNNVPNVESMTFNCG